MGIERFEDIKAWQAARELTRSIYAATRQESFSRDFGLRDQIQRASASVMSNIAEGFDRHSNKEFLYFLNIAFASCSEVRSQLYIALDQNYINQNVFDELYNQCTQTSKLIYGFMNYLKTSSHQN
jgi:four helix bundle protein